MKTRIPLLAVAALAMVGFTGCAGGAPAGDDTDTTPPATSAPTEDTGGDDTDDGAAAGDAVVMVATTDLGEVVVDADGMTVYMFDNDTQGTDTSSCTGMCLNMWPPVLTDSETPTGEGVTGQLGTIETPDGELQVTLNGWPLYLYAGDMEPGDVTGQGVGGIWWVLDPAGERMADEANSSAPGY